MNSMKRLGLSFFGIVLFMNLSFSQEEFKSHFPLKWKSKIGITTYRTNILEEGGFIYLGSNGLERRSNVDSLDGVFKIDPKSGKIIQSYQSQLLGDNDATAIALKDGKLYFGTDNYYFYCFDEKSGQELWKYATPFDVESAPCIADLDSDGEDEVVFCVQRHGVYCLNTKDGSEKWKLDSISSHSGNVAPLVVDCNNDGVLDVIGGFRGTPENSKLASFKMDHYGDYLLALDGKTGLPIWSKSAGSGIHASPFLYEEGGELRIVSIAAYGGLQVLNLKGELIKDMGFGYNMFMSPVMYKTTLLLANRIYGFGDDLFERNENDFNKYIGSGSQDIEMELGATRSATTVVADVRGNGQMQFIAVNEEGQLAMCNEDSTEIVQYTFPAGAEATPLVKDVDGDGFLEILIASLDGNLYCYETKSKGRVHYGQFRWNNTNVPKIK